MKKASQLMFLIGKIINIIAIIVLGIFMAIGSFILAGTLIKNRGAMLFIAGAVIFIIAMIILCIPVILFIICSKQNKKIVEGSMETGPRVDLIIIGVFTDNIFYILSGIFSLVARNQELNGTAQNETQQ